MESTHRLEHLVEHLQRLVRHMLPRHGRHADPWLPLPGRADADHHLLENVQREHAREGVLWSLGRQPRLGMRRGDDGKIPAEGCLHLVIKMVPGEQLGSSMKGRACCVRIVRIVTNP